MNFDRSHCFSFLIYLIVAIGFEILYFILGERILSLGASYPQAIRFSSIFTVVLINIFLIFFYFSLRKEDLRLRIRYILILILALLFFGH